MSLQPVKTKIREDSPAETKPEKKKSSFSDGIKSAIGPVNEVKESSERKSAEIPETLDIPDFKHKSTKQTTPSEPKKEPEKEAPVRYEPAAEPTRKQNKAFVNDLKNKMKTKKERGVQRTFYYDKDISDYIDKLCEETGVGPSEVMRYILREYMENHKI